MGYRYSTSGFYTLSDTMINTWMATNLMTVMMKIRRCGALLQFVLHQTWQTAGQYLPELGDYGSFYLSGSQQTYWHTINRIGYYSLATTRKLKISHWRFLELQ